MKKNIVVVFILTVMLLSASACQMQQEDRISASSNAAESVEDMIYNSVQETDFKNLSFPDDELYLSNDDEVYIENCIEAGHRLADGYSIKESMEGLDIMSIEGYAMQEDGHGILICGKWWNECHERVSSIVLRTEDSGQTWEVNPKTFVYYREMEQEMEQEMLEVYAFDEYVVFMAYAGEVGSAAICISEDYGKNFVQKLIGEELSDTMYGYEGEILSIDKEKHTMAIAWKDEEVIMEGEYNMECQLINTLYCKEHQHKSEKCEH